MEFFALAWETEASGTARRMQSLRPVWARLSKEAQMMMEGIIDVNRKGSWRLNDGSERVRPHRRDASSRLRRPAHAVRCARVGSEVLHHRNGALSHELYGVGLESRPVAGGAARGLRRLASDIRLSTCTSSSRRSALSC